MAKSGLKSVSRRAGVGLAVLLLAGQGVASEAKEYRQAAPAPALYSKGEGDYLCPSGYEKRGDRCVTAVTRQPTVSCPAGTVDDGHACVGTQRVNPSFVCPEGFVASSPVSSKKKHRNTHVPTCVSSESLPAIMRCPKGFELSHDGDCVAAHQERPVFVCEHGDQEAGKCVARSLFPAEMTCPEGFTPEGTSSHKKSYQHREVFVEQCTRLATQMPIPECPEEYLLEEDFSSCTRSILRDPHFVCPELFELRGGVCAKDIFFPQTSFCPPGYELAESLTSSSSKSFKSHSAIEQASAVCIRSVAVEAERYCKDGWTLNAADGSCAVTHVEQALVKCPVGTENSQTETGQLICRDVDVQEPEKTCESGVEAAPGRCVTTEVFDASLACGLNGELRGETCVELESIAPTNTCPEGWIVSSPFGKGKHFVDQAPSCLKIDAVAPVAVCHHGMLASATECEDVQVTDPRPTCQAPMALNADGVCYSETRMNLVGVCPDGYAHHGSTCVRSSTANFELQCPIGFELRTETNSSADLSHNGFEKFKKVSAAKKQETVCVKVDTYPAAFACPEDYTLTDGSCVKSISIPAKPPKMGPAPVSMAKKSKKDFHKKDLNLKAKHAEKSLDLKEKHAEKMAELKEKHSEKTADLRAHLSVVKEGVQEHMQAKVENIHDIKEHSAHSVHAKADKIHETIEAAKDHLHNK